MWLRVIEKSRLLGKFPFQRNFSDQKVQTKSYTEIQSFENMVKIKISLLIKVYL